MYSVNVDPQNDRKNPSAECLVEDLGPWAYSGSPGSSCRHPSNGKKLADQTL